MSSSEILFATLPTPCALVDLDRVERNTAWMAARAHRLGVHLRPHVKTHKTVEGARLQVAGHSGAVTVSTLAEAALLMDHGFTDVLWAVPVSPGRAQEVVALASRPGVQRMDVLTDHRETLRWLAAACKGGPPVPEGRLGVWIEVDCGDGRGGLSPDHPELEPLARAILAMEGVRFRGVLTHGGQSYGAHGAEELAAFAEVERAEVVRTADRLRAAGIEVPAVSLGSTPTLTAAEHLEGVTEVRPGNYVFFDATQMALGSCGLESVAFTVLATIIGRSVDRGTLVIDAGALALSRDAGPSHLGPWPPGGHILGPEGALDDRLKLVSLSQEHGVVQVQGGLGPAGIERWPVGGRLRIVPNHSCLAAALHPVYHVVRGAEVVGAWRPARGWSAEG